MKTLCVRCFKEIEKGDRGTIEFPKQSGVFIRSKNCRDHAVVKIRGKAEIDFLKVRKHANYVRQKQTLAGNVRLLSSLLEKEKPEWEDLAPLLNCLTPKQKLVLSLVGIGHLSRSVHHEPKKLTAEINRLIRLMRG